VRRSLAALHPRANAVSRTEASLEAQPELLRCYYNFARPHQSLRQGRQRRTPAMAAGLTTRLLTLREIFSIVIPLKEPRRAACVPRRRFKSEGVRMCGRGVWWVSGSPQVAVPLAGIGSRCGDRIDVKRLPP